MKRIDIHYGGQTYSVGGRELHDLEQEIIDGIASGGHWMLVNDGEGQRLDAHLLLMPGSPIALIPVPEQVDNPDEEVA
jgi:hypothetical protein